MAGGIRKRESQIVDESHVFLVSDINIHCPIKNQKSIKQARHVGACLESVVNRGNMIRAVNKYRNDVGAMEVTWEEFI